MRTEGTSQKFLYVWKNVLKTGSIVKFEKQTLEHCISKAVEELIRERLMRK
jgi:hypothetical protein